MKITLKSIDRDIWLDDQIIFKAITNRFVFQYGSSLFVIRNKGNNILQSLWTPIHKRSGVCWSEEYLVYNYYKKDTDKSVGYLKKTPSKIIIDLAGNSRNVTGEVCYCSFFGWNRMLNIGSTSYYFLTRKFGSMPRIVLRNEDNIDELDVLAGCFMLYSFDWMDQDGLHLDSDPG